MRVKGKPRQLKKDEAFQVIKKIEDQFCVIAEDSGKNMGCYPTRELAERRLRQIEAFSNNQKKNKKQLEHSWSITSDGSRVHNSWLETSMEEE